jgi:hypothetical protein
MAQKQTTQGTPATPAIPAAAVPGAYKSPLVNGGLAPVRTVAQLAETDSNRDQGISYVTGYEVQGSPEVYVRDANIGFWLQATLGADAVTGTTPNFTHALTPSNTIPYLTSWRNVSDTLWEQFLDCKVSSLTIAGAAGGALTATPTLLGRSSTRLTTDPSISPAIVLDNAPVYTYNDMTVTLSGGVTALVSQFSMTLDNQVSSQHTNAVAPIDVVEGLRRCTLSFTMILQNLNEYNAFNYGSTSGTVASSSLYTTSADFALSHGTNNSIDLSFPSIAYDAFPVDVNAAGNPITVAVTAVAQRNVSGVLAATVKNQAAVY